MNDNTGNMEDQAPEVSIVIPVYNDNENLDKCLESISNLNYPSDRIYIYVVDNNSITSPKTVTDKYLNVNIMEEGDQSSYSARNAALKIINTDIIAFTDSDCIVDKYWLKNGIEKLSLERADLVGGRVDFIFSKKRTISEIYDSKISMNQKNYIKYDNAAITANLIVRKKVFDKIGPFKNSVKSGEDKGWTRRAVDHGFKLIYSDNAIVKHPARKFRELIKKQYRIGTGQPVKWKQNQFSIANIIFQIFVNFIPNLSKNMFRNEGSNIILYIIRLISLLAVSWIANITVNFGRIKGFSYLPKHNRNIK